MTRSRTALALFLSALMGGAFAVILGAVLIATDVIDVGDDTTRVVQQSISKAASDPAEAEDGLTVGEIYDRAGPGVVFIQAQLGGSASESPFGLGPREGTASGSGFVLDEDGNILTNAHVVEGADEVFVRFGDDALVEAKVVGSDLSTDLAVVQIKEERDREGLKPLPLGDSKSVRVGDPVVAIGNPFGFDRTVTTGIVSALQRQIQAPNRFAINNVIQTDASINPGNSGGPLLDARGRVIGVNSQIATGGSRGSVGIGFAVPINTAKEVIPQLEENGKVERAYMGVTTSPITKQVAEDLNLPVDEGALVQEVVEGGPADKAGIRGGRTPIGEDLTAGGDIIVKVDGEDINRPEDVAAAILDDKPGDTIEVEYFRGDERKRVKVKLGERPNEFQLEQDAPPQDEEVLPFP